jgi:hypothetical protein
METHGRGEPMDITRWRKVVGKPSTMAIVMVCTMPAAKRLCGGEGIKRTRKLEGSSHQMRVMEPPRLVIDVSNEDVNCSCGSGKRRTAAATFSFSSRSIVSATAWSISSSVEAFARGTVKVASAASSEPIAAGEEATDREGGKPSYSGDADRTPEHAGAISVGVAGQDAVQKKIMLEASVSADQLDKTRTGRR